MSVRHCRHCHHVWPNVPEHVIELFHYCSAGPSDSRQPRRPTIDESRVDWARRALGAALTDAIDELLRRVEDDDEA